MGIKANLSQSRINDEDYTQYVAVNDGDKKLEIVFEEMSNENTGLSDVDANEAKDSSFHQQWSADMDKLVECLDQSYVTKETVTKELAHNCNICEYSAISALGLQKHMRSHFVKSFKCAICKYSCSKAGDLKKHNRRHHAGKKPNTCMNELTFSELIDLHRVCRTHTGEETGNVGSHKLLQKKLKGERLYKCKICS